MSRRPIHQESTGNVFADLGLDNADERLAKANLAQRISEQIARSGMTQQQAADTLGVDQPKVSALLRGRLSGFSTDRLLRFALAIGYDVDLMLHEPPASQPRGTMHVTAVAAGSPKLLDPYDEMSADAFDQHVAGVLRGQQRSAAVSIRIPKSLVHKVKTAATRLGVTPQSFIEDLLEQGARARPVTVRATAPKPRAVGARTAKRAPSAGAKKRAVVGPKKAAKTAKRVTKPRAKAKS